MTPAREAEHTDLEIAQVFVKMSLFMLRDRPQGGERCAWIVSSGNLNVIGSI